ncbi:hypothetical protein AAVH_32079 [Aphelenchoides avenae]|nr:hypothetical protein AAVH_32079 [Aphelenchus avenae]
MDDSDTTQAQIDLVTPLYNLVQAQFQMLGAMMEAQNRLMKGVEQSVAKNTERLVGFTSVLTERRTWTSMIS